jgi:hypothetical protein
MAIPANAVAVMSQPESASNPTPESIVKNDQKSPISRRLRSFLKIIENQNFILPLGLIG